MRYVHTNLIAQDWRRLARFYEAVFACVPVPPERSLRGAWLARGTGVDDAALEGVHLRLPGSTATLEIFAYDTPLERPTPSPNRLGWGHLAFEVDDVAAAVRAVIEHGGAALGEIVSREIEGAGRLTFTYVRDPEGNVLEVQRRDRATVPTEEAYAAWAATYDEGPNPTRDLDAAVLRAALPPLEDLDVLELGCGTGKNTVALLDARSVTALDLSPAMLAQAQAKVSADHVRFVRHDLREGLPFPDGSFDLVALDLVLEHVADVRSVFVEVARSLRPGGVAIVVELHPFRQLMGKRARFERDGEVAEVEAYVHPVSELVGAARAAGLAIDAMGEHVDGSAPAPARPGVVPRLLSLSLRVAG